MDNVFSCSLKNPRHKRAVSCASGKWASTAQSLIAYDDSPSIHKLLGLDSAEIRGQPVGIGPALRLAKAEAPEHDYELKSGLHDLIWDDYTCSFVALEDRAVLSLTPSGEDTLLVSVLAGTPGGDEQSARDGPGPSAHFRMPERGTLTSDHSGALYLIDRRPPLQRVIRKLQLPASLRAVQHPAQGQQPGTQPIHNERGAQAAAAAPAAAAGAVASRAAAATEAVAATGVVVSSMRLPTEWLRNLLSAELRGMMHLPAGIPGGDCLVLCTVTAVYRLPLGTWRPGERTQEPQLLAGAEHARDAPCVDGRGSEVRFHYIISPLLLNGEGAVLLLDHNEDEDVLALRRVSPSDGAVTTTASLPTLRADIGVYWPSIAASLLSTGTLSAIWVDERVCNLYDVGLTPPAYLRPPPPAARRGDGPPPRSLPTDLGALLDAQPDGTAVLTIRVGERRFHVHRAILSARCDYFKQRLAGDGFADARAPELELLDADPTAFALLLRWLYTGGADIPLEQARGMAELADRLLLPELCDAALEVVAAAITPSTVVDSLLWAAGCCESRGGSFAQLLKRLQVWYVSHHEEVWLEAKPSVRRLMEERSDLACELIEAQQEEQQRRGAKRQRV